MMKKNYPNRLLVCTSIGLVILFLLVLNDMEPYHLRKQNPYRESQQRGKSPYAMPPEAMDQFLDMTMDPQLNRRTPERMLAVRKQLKSGKLRFDKRSEIMPWEERGPNNIAGRTRGVLFDLNDPTGNTVWAGSVGGGLWKGENFLSDEVLWTPVNDFFQNIAVSSLAQDPLNPNVMYFGTGEGWFNGDAIRGLGIWRTEDGGNSWDQLASTNDPIFSYIQKLQIDTNSDLYACTRSDGILKSTDGGTSWFKVLGGGVGGGFSDRAADIEMASNGDLYATLGIGSSPDGIYKSTDNGATWMSFMNMAPENGLPNEGFERIEIAISPSNDQVVYALLENDEDGDCLGIYRTDDGGQNWISLPVPPSSSTDNFARNQAWYNLIAQVDPTNELIVYIGGIDLHRSTDGGQNWETISERNDREGLPAVHVDQHNIIFHGNNRYRAIAANDGGVYAMSINPEGSLGPEYCVVDHRAFFPDFINSVQVGSINNLSGAGLSTTQVGYSDYTGISTQLEVGQSYTISFSANTSFVDSKAGAWIDWNGNFIFEEEEQLLSASGSSPYSATFTVPNNAVSQTVRLRVRVQFGPDYVPDPCAHSGFQSGETEDYSIVIDNCFEGNQCDDGDPCTINDTLDALCNCAGQFVDINNDGNCDLLPKPSFVPRNLNYNVTQFYSCAIHPDANSNVILGGTQDNGTHLFENPGMNSTREVTGGDGAFCFIDQDEPEIQISTYIYNNIRVTSDSWNDHVRFSIGENTGHFINPMDYDSRSNTLITAHEEGVIGRVREVGSNNLQDTLYIEALGDQKVTAVTVDPNVEDRVWLVTRKSLEGDFEFNSRIIALDQSNQDQPVVAQEIEINNDFFFGPAYGRTLAIAQGNSQRMLLLFSNSGVPNVWLTNDGGHNWQNIDGDLPEIAMYWIMFDPLNPDGVIVSSDMGIWTTSKMNGDNTTWTSMNEGLANVRVDMLKYRPSDQTMVAATHGRGIFTSSLVQSQGCDDSFSVDIVQESESTAQAIPVGGTAPYTYSWTDAELQTTEIANQLAYGTYTVTVRDANGCIAFNHLTIEAPDADTEDIIASAGSSFSSPDLLIDWTLGEILVDQHASDELLVGEGFHQIAHEEEEIIEEDTLLPDYELISIELNSEVFFPGELIFDAGSLIIRNNGTVSTPSEFMAILISEDNVIDITDPIFSFAQIDSLDPGEEDTLQFSALVDAGTPSGPYFILACLDEFNVVEEVTEDNNCNEVAITVGTDSDRPDLVVSDIELVSTEFQPGDNTLVSVTIQNIGLTQTSSNFLEHRIFLSNDDSADMDDVQGSFFASNVLLPQESFTRDVIMEFPNDLSTGPYFIIVETDYGQGLQESDEENNFNSVQIDIVDGSIAPGIQSLTSSSKSLGARIYPNPTTDVLYIQTNSSEAQKYEVIRSDGTVYKTGSVNGSSKIDTESLLPGIYWLLLENEQNNDKSWHKFVKMN